MYEPSNGTLAKDRKETEAIFDNARYIPTRSHTVLTMSSSKFYQLSAMRGDGQMQDMSQFKGTVVYATNVASK